MKCPNPWHVAKIVWYTQLPARCPTCQEERRAPTLRGFYGRHSDPAKDLPGGREGWVPWAIHIDAWKGYAEAGHGDQSAERVAERGGFGYREIQCAIARHYNACIGGLCKIEHPPVPGWEPR